MTEYLASPFRERTRTHRSHPSELSSCSAARCSRSRSARRRSSRSDSDNRRRDFVAMMAPSDEGPPAAGRCRPNAPRRGAKIRRPVRSGPGPRQSSPRQASPRCHARHREDDAGYWFHEDQRTETSVRRESWSLLRPTRRVGAPPLECTNSGHVGGADLVAAFVPQAVTLRRSQGVDGVAPLLRGRQRSCAVGGELPDSRARAVIFRWRWPAPILGRPKRKHWPSRPYS